jgi:adenine-specific DNA methylase
MAQKTTGATPKRAGANHTAPPRVLIEEWLPAAAIGVECMREESSTSAKPPTKYFHVWWARRPLCASRAAVLGSVLPADFPHDLFEKLLGFGLPGPELVRIRRLMDEGVRVEGGFNCERAFKARPHFRDLDRLHDAARCTWGDDLIVIDPMAGGGSIPLESARLGFRTLANEYNPVACSILEATLDYPFRLGEGIAAKARQWTQKWLQRIEKRLSPLYPEQRSGRVHAYIFARTVPCPDTGFETPLVPDWHLLKPKNHSGCGEQCWFAVPVVDRNSGTWTVRVQQGGRGAGQTNKCPPPTYRKGNGISLFSGRKTDGAWHGQQISADYIKTMAQQGRMRSALYAIVVKTASGLTFAPPEPADLKALTDADGELARVRAGWEKAGIIPIELYPQVTSDERPRLYGMSRWADMFSPRQLLCMGVLVQELRGLRPEIAKVEGEQSAEAIFHLLALALDKFLNYNCTATRWHSGRAVLAGKMDRHDYAFKSTFGEIAACKAGEGLAWAVENTLKAFREVAQLSRCETTEPTQITLGSATNMAHIADGSVTAVVIDPPYADNVQYSELADFFYVWLKRTQGHRRPEWFSTYLCEHDQEAVVNAARFRDGKKKVKDARTEANAFYQDLMTGAFKECKRILRDDGVLTVMFTHKKQEAWEALFTSLIRAGFKITATWPVKTESEYSLHQAKKNAAQSTVILVARKRTEGAGVGYFDIDMEQRIRDRARQTAERLRNEGLNPVDQLVGSFGPAMEVYSQYDEVRTDTGQPVGVDRAIDLASDAVSKWRIEQLAARGLGGVEGEGQFALLCWDVLGAAEFRFNEAKLLGHAVGMDVDNLVAAGLVNKVGDKIKILSAKERRRERALDPDEAEELLFGTVVTVKKRKKKDVLKVHPNDPHFRTALDACHALALRYTEAGGGKGGIGNAKALARQQNWTADSNVAQLMQALVNAAPEAVRFPKKTGKGTEDPNAAATKFPEFRAWHSLLPELFGMEPPEWKQRAVERDLFNQEPAAEDEEIDEQAEDEVEDEAAEDEE